MFTLECLLSSRWLKAMKLLPMRIQKGEQIRYHTEMGHVEGKFESAGIWKPLRGTDTYKTNQPTNKQINKEPK